MCGICGVIQIGGEPRPVVAPEVLSHMTDLMTHRGPNDRGVYIADGVALGVRRLSIVDVEGGHQPFGSEDGAVQAIQNGELYNHEELRAELAAGGHCFLSRCDTEVLPHLYEQYGSAFPERLRGKFGAAVWDGRRRRGVLARDRLGVKPLYYAVRGDLVVFASELKSLLASGLVEPELDYEALDAFLALGYVPGPRTPLSGVSKLLPGHSLVVDPKGVRIEQYWHYPEPAPESLSADECAEGLLAELDEAVRLRLMSDVPLGAMLSGGLDSSTIVALMARHSSEPVKTFTIGFAGAGEANELGAARQVAELFGTDHHELELSLDDSSVDLAQLAWHQDEPLSDLSALGFLAISDLAARHVTVALSGQGADELLGGYRKHQAAALCGAWQRLPRPVARLGRALALRAPARFGQIASTLAATDPSTRLVAMSGEIEDDLRASLARGPLAALDGHAALRAVRSRANGLPDDPLAATLYLDAQLALVDDMLHYFDRSSMARSLEVRVPFLDHRVVEFCARIPARYKVRRLERKHILRRAVRGLLPDSIVDRQRGGLIADQKIGFFADSVDAWFRAQANAAIADWLLAPEPRYAELLDPAGVRRLLDEQHSGRDSDHWELLLSVLVLEVWLSTYLPRALARPVEPREQIRIPA